MKRYYPQDNATKMTAAKVEVIDIANGIIEDYQAQGYDLTLRQLYYQFVARGHIPNRQNEYKRLGDIVQQGRYAGLIDWNAIVDRTRFARSNQHWEGPGEIVRAAAEGFRFDLWEDQPTRVEVWIEKDALIGVIEDVCRQWDIGYFSCRGYVSASEMWAAGRRFGRYMKAGQRVVVLHLGDHDPSGVDMSGDIQRRLDDFTRGDSFHDDDEATWRERVEDDRLTVEVRRIALNMDQIQRFNPPPNPAKLTDSRSDRYVREFGTESWELDALDPRVMSNLIATQVQDLVVQGSFDEAEARQEAARVRLRLMADEIEAEEADE